MGRGNPRAYFNKIKDAVEITIPKLNEMATEQVDLASVPYVTFIANKKQGGEPATYSFVLRGYVRHWLGNVWAEYDQIKLTDVVAARPQTPEAAPAGAARRSAGSSSSRSSAVPAQAGTSIGSAIPAYAGCGG